MVQTFLLGVSSVWSSQYCEEFLDRLESSISDLQSAEENTTDRDSNKDSPTPPSGEFWDYDKLRRTVQSTSVNYSARPAILLQLQLQGTRFSYATGKPLEPQNFKYAHHQENGFNKLYFSLCGEWECSRSELELARAQEANSLFQ